MKLYYSPGACSLSPHIALRESGLKFDLERVDFKTGKTETGKDFRAVSPNGYVPALEIAPGDVLTEGPAIVQYIADQAPAAVSNRGRHPPDVTQSVLTTQAASDAGAIPRCGWPDELEAGSGHL